MLGVGDGLDDDNGKARLPAGNGGNHGGIALQKGGFVQRGVD